MHLRVCGLHTLGQEILVWMAVWCGAYLLLAKFFVPILSNLNDFMGN